MVFAQEVEDEEHYEDDAEEVPARFLFPAAWADFGISGTVVLAVWAAWHGGEQGCLQRWKQDFQDIRCDDFRKISSQGLTPPQHDV